MSGNPSAQAWYDAGDAARRAGDLQEAERAFQQAIAADPAHANALYRLGELALFRGDRSAADELFRRTLTVQPSHAWARKQLQRMADQPASPPVSRQPVSRPACQPTGRGIVGVVESVRRSSESFQMRTGSRPVLTIRVRQQAPDGPPEGVVAGEMRGKQIRGAIDSGDWVEFPAGWRPGDKLSAIRNLTTCAEVKVVESRLLTGISALIVAFVIAWIAIAFYMVARAQLGSP